MAEISREGAVFVGGLPYSVGSMQLIQSMIQSTSPSEGVVSVEVLLFPSGRSTQKA